MTKKVLFRADGTRESGLGHMYRIFSVMDMVQDSYEFSFVTKDNSVLEVIPQGAEFKTIPNTATLKEELSFLTENYPSNEYTFVADGYHFDAEYQKAIVGAGYKMMYIDDLTTEHMYAHVVINHSPHCTPEDFSIENYTELGLGTRYALLRKEFIETLNQSPIQGSLFICFGGGDKDNLTWEVAQAANNNDDIKSLNIVLGGAADKNQFENAQWKKKVNIFKNIPASEMVDIMCKSEYAVVPSSTVLVELMSIGVPAISGYFVDNQKKIYASLDSHNAFVGVGDMHGTNWTEAIERLLVADKMVMVETQRRLIDHKSPERILNKILGLTLNARRADMNDCLDIYNWANDPLVRQNSFHSDEISLDEHKKWYKKQLDSKSSEIFIIETGKSNKVAIVRFSIGENESIVGVNMNPLFRGRGLARRALSLGCSAYFDNHNLPLKANIKFENVASHRIFVANGFVEKGEERINNIPSKYYYRYE